MAHDDQDDPQDDGWIESTEGDLDPDLTEETGYLASDGAEPRNNWLPFVWKVAALMLVVALVGSVVLPVLM